MGDKAWKRTERAVCRALAAWWYPERFPMNRKFRAEELPFRRTPGSGAWAGRNSMAADVQGPDDWVFSVEIKDQKAWSFDQIIRGKSNLIERWWKQSERSAKKSHQIPLLVFTKAFMDHYVRVKDTDASVIKDRCRSGTKWSPFLRAKGYSYFTLKGFCDLVSSAKVKEHREPLLTQLGRK